MKKTATCLFLFIAFYYSPAQLPGLTITGDPASVNGATFTYKATVRGVVYDLAGILFKPATGNRFPAVIINHGTKSSTRPFNYAHNMAKKMVGWGLVCIAVNLTHSSNVPIGSPGTGDSVNWGASTYNMQRAMKCWDILASLTYVDTACIMAFGHSRGAFLTTALLGTYPNKFSAAGHTAGGVGHPTDVSYPTYTMVKGIRKPYIMHHGTSDNVVNIIYDNNMDSVLTQRNITHQYHVYNGYTHNTISFDSLVLARTRQWFATYGCVAPATGRIEFQPEKNEPSPTRIYPVPAIDKITIYTGNETINSVQLYSASGVLLYNGKQTTIGLASMHTGVYYVRVNTAEKTTIHKMVKQ